MSQEQQQIFPYLQRLLNGAHVEWKPLGEVTKYEQPSKYIVKNTDYKDHYHTPVLTAGKSFILGYTNEDTGIYEASSSPVIIFDDFTTDIKWVDFDFKVKSSAMKLITSTDEDKVLLRYLYFLLTTMNDATTVAEHKRQWISNYCKKSVPIPPMEVQERIVEILDKFTELQAELQAELALREKQYIYFRDQLLSKDKTERPIRWTPLSKVGSVCMCKRILKNQTSETSGIPFYKIGTFGGTPNAYISKELFERYKAQYSYPNKGDILLSASGTIGRTVIYDGEDAYFQDSNIVWIDHNEETVLNKYLYYCYQIADWKVSKGGTIARLYNKNLLDTTIPIPFPDDKNRSLEEQERIVRILDRFETMVHSIKEGLPREIELRRKQYEYFRDQLLTFPKG